MPVPSLAREMARHLAFLRYASAEVFRSGRRTVSAIVGVLLAVVFVAGTFIAIDSSARAVLAGQLSFVESDFAVIARTPDTHSLVADLLAVPGVEALAPFRHLNFDETGRWDGPSLQASGIAVDPGRLPRLLTKMELTGQMTLGQGEAVLSEGIANRLGVKVGDGVYLRGTVVNQTSGAEDPRYVNLTVEGILGPTDPPWAPRFSSNAPPREFVAVHIDDAEWLQRQLTEDFFPRIDVEIFVDPGLLDPYNLAGTEGNLARLERELDQVASGYEGHVSNVISTPLGNLRVLNTLFRGLFLALSLPLILLALYLGAIGVDMGHAERRRELAIVRSRGASDRQLFGQLLLESVLVGVVAGLLGLAGGLGLSRLLLGSVTFAFAESQPPLEELFLSPGTIVGTVALSVLFTLAVSYKSARRTARLPVVETLRYDAPGEAKIEYRPTTDLVLLALGATAFAVVLLGPAVGGFLLFLAGSLFFVLLPVAPALVILGATRLLTRSSPRVYEWASRLLKPLAGNLHHVIARNLARNPRRASGVAVIIALGLAYGLFVSALFASQEAWEDRSLRAVIGADMAVFPPAGNVTFVDEVGLLDGVSGVAAVFPVPARVEVGFGQVFALDPEAYFAVANPEPWYFLSGGPEAALTALAQDGQVLVSQQYREDTLLEVGEGLQLAYEAQNPVTQEVETRVLDVTVAGVVRGLPGTVTDGRSLPRAVYGSPATFRPVLEATIPPEIPQPEFFPEGSTKLLVHLEEGADWRALKETLLGRGALRVVVLAEAQGQGGLSPVAAALQGFLRLEFAFVVAVLTVGLGLVVVAASLERDSEFAAIAARGASGRQTAGILLGEGLSIVLVGLAVAAVVGLAASYAGTQSFLQGPGQMEVLVPYPFVLPTEGLLLMGAAAVSMVLTSLLVAWRVARINLAQVLRRRVG